MTKKTGSAGRFGSRYGRTIRQKVADIEKRQKRKQLCPYCKHNTAKRISMGIFSCLKCNSKFTSGAYEVMK